MKKIKYIFLIILFIYICQAAHAQRFKPFESLRVIKTEHFDFIFPKESEPSARLLASYANSVYKDLISTLGIEVPARIPVTFAPHTDMFNGYYSHFPYPHIMLFDTPMDLEWSVYENNLKGLFLHELVHAVTINTGSPFNLFMRKIFGFWASPAYLTAPLFMIEGATVSFESLTGFGRANDPLTKQKLRQAIYEDKFLTPFQVSGVYDLPDQSGIYYEYGGLFSAWLQKEYGMEKYADLWKALGGGKDVKFSFIVYRSDFYNAFRIVYGINIMDAWNAFKNSLTIAGIEEKPLEVLPAQYRFLTKKRYTISKIAANADNIFILNSTESKIYIYNAKTGVTRSFNADTFYSNDLDVSECGSNLLVSEYSAAGDRFKAVVTELRSDSGKKTGRSIKRLYKARYFRDGVIGIKSELHNNCIVYADFSGSEEILFRGNETLMFSGPQALDNDRIVFIAAKNGIRKLLLYNYAEGELFSVDDSNGGAYWNYSRGLNVSENKLLLSYNSDDRMYKLASVDFDSMQAVFSKRDFSGGVFNPVSIDGNIYYSGNFFSGDEVLRFPEAADSLSGMRIKITLEPANPADFGLIAKVKTEETPPSLSIENDSIIPSKPFLGISYMNPFKLWLPLPLIRSNAEDLPFLTLDGGGIFSILKDPADRNTITFYAYYDASYMMLRMESLTWQSTIPGFPVTLTFIDMVEMNSYALPYRITQLGLSAGFTHTPKRFSYGFSLGAGYSRAALDDGSQSAYSWKETGNLFYYSTVFTITNRLRRQHEMFGNGFSVSIRGTNIMNDYKPRVEGLFQANSEKRLPLSLVLYGAIDKSGMNIQGASNSYGETLYNSYSSQEYFKGPKLEWIAGAEAGIGVFSLEIQRNLSHVYYNRLRGRLSVRNVLYDSQGDSKAEGISINQNINLAQSLVLKIGLVTSMVPLKMSPFFIEPYIWAAWKFSNSITQKEDLLYFGFNYNFQY